MFVDDFCFALTGYLCVQMQRLILCVR